MLSYQKQLLVISLPCKHPEFTHEGLISAIITNLKFQMVSDQPISPILKMGNNNLLGLLEALMPDESQLKTMHESH